MFIKLAITLFVLAILSFFTGLRIDDEDWHKASMFLAWVTAFCAIAGFISFFIWLWML